MIPIQDTVRSRSVPLVTWGIILVNAVVFFFELTLPARRLDRLFHELGMVPARLEYDPVAWVTLFTCMFLHGGWGHFIGNMWALYLFGENVEDRMGRAGSWSITCSAAWSRGLPTTSPTWKAPCRPSGLPGPSPGCWGPIS